MIRVIVVMVIASLSLAAAQSDIKCGVCMAENEVRCESETTYSLCFDGTAFGEVQECPVDTVCTNSVDFCLPKAQVVDSVKNVCGDNSIGGCGKCLTGKKYTCVSQTQAARCVNGAIAGVINCKGDEICIADVEGTSVCVPQCAADYLKKNATCTSDAEYTTPTSAPSTTPSVEDRNRVCNEASKGVKTLFFYTYFDSSCRTGVYCQRSSPTSTDWKSLYRPCANPKPYFDTILKTCVATKPKNCPVATTTPVPTRATDPTPAPSTVSVPTRATDPTPAPSSVPTQTADPNTVPSQATDSTTVPSTVSVPTQTSDPNTVPSQATDPTPAPSTVSVPTQTADPNTVPSQATDSTTVPSTVSVPTQTADPNTVPSQATDSTTVPSQVTDPTPAPVTG